MHSTPTLILACSASCGLHKHVTSEKHLRFLALMEKCWQQVKLCSSLCYEREKEFNIPYRFTAFLDCKSRGNCEEKNTCFFVAYDVVHGLQQWRLVVKMAGRAAKFHLWLNMQDCRPAHGCL